MAQKAEPCAFFQAAAPLAEIYYGIAKSPVKKDERRWKIQRIREELTLFDFNENAATTYGFIRASLERQGLPISERDLQIASIAAANDLSLVTHNTREFSRIKQLQVEGWAE